VNEHYTAVLQDLHAQRNRIDIAIQAIQALQGGLSATEQGVRWTDLTEAPHAAPVVPKRYIPADPEELKALASNLSNQGYGLGEVKTMLELTSAQMQDFFATDV
jgi:hypothetical protein